jgi:hypothetical protein
MPLYWIEARKLTSYHRTQSHPLQGHKSIFEMHEAILRYTRRSFTLNQKNSARRNQKNQINDTKGYVKTIVMKLEGSAVLLFTMLFSSINVVTEGTTIFI